MPLMELALPQRVNIGITYDSILNLVPEIEERDAALFGLYNWTAWSRLSVEQKAAGIAHYRLTNLMKAHIQEAQNHAANVQRAQAGTEGQ
jgi:hypothetical protein